jgi:tetratricopeptide (TPR) repeat protein
MNCNRYLIVALLAGASAVLPIAAEPALANREPTLAGSYLAGRSAGRQRDAEEAAGYYTNALKLDPGNPQLIERLFQYRLQQGEMQEAEALAGKVITFNSQHRLARVVLGLKEMRAGKFEAARSNFGEASYTPIGELAAALLSAWAYAGDGALNPALEELAKLEANESFAGFRLFHEALIADYLNSKPRADQAYKRAYEEASGSLRVVQAYAQFLLRNGKTAEAREVLQTFLRSSEQNALIEHMISKIGNQTSWPLAVKDAEAGAGEALFAIAAAMNDEESAEVALLYAHLAKSSKGEPDLTATLLGDIYSGIQRYQLSNEAYESISVASPLRVNAEIQMALNFQRMDNKAEAQRRLNMLVQRVPDNVEAWTTLGNVLRNNEDYAAALPAYTQAISISNKKSQPQWQLFYFRGICNERVKKWPDAESDFQAALKIVPDEASVLNYYGYSLIDRKEKLTEAMNMVKRAVDLRPNDGYIVDSLGWAFYQIGDFEAALVHLERAADLKPADPIIADHLGDVYWRVGRKLEAKFQWQHAKDNNPEPDDLARIEKKLREGMVDPPPVKPAETQTDKPDNG